MTSVKECDILLQKMMDNPRFSISETFTKEKQILVDPLSLKVKDSSTTTTAPTTLLHPPQLQPPKLRFLSLSLPNSGNSSPRFGSPPSKLGGSPEPQYQVLQEVHFAKSKSCSEARACATIEELDHWLTKLSAQEHHHHDKWQWNNHGSFTKTEAVKESPKGVNKHMKTPSNDGFKCNALCLYLPSFVGKLKLAKTRKEEEAAMSRTVSLEKFECGSWASAAIFHDGESNNSFFDLPIEMIHYSASEVYSPTAASFVYEKELKGVLKNGLSRASTRKSDASSRHVRFSTSSSPASNPSSPAFCISPRLRKAREDFNSFLAAQTA